LHCGGESKENCTYIDQPATTVAPAVSATADGGDAGSGGGFGGHGGGGGRGRGGGTCIYTVCKCDEDICRIRFDFDVSSLKRRRNTSIIRRII